MQENTQPLDPAAQMALVRRSLYLGEAPISASMAAQKTLAGIEMRQVAQQTYRQALVCSVASGVASGLSPKASMEDLSGAAGLITNLVTMILVAETQYALERGLPLPEPESGATEGLIQ